MSDALLALAWLVTLGAGVGGLVLLRLWGLRATFARDLLHVGAGVWVLGWRGWSSPALPIALVAAAALATRLVPVAARRGPWVALVQGAFSDHRESWTGLVHYTTSFVVFTAIGLLTAPFPAAAGLLALALGDGVGGAVGRRFGRHRFAVGAAKAKSVEGSLTVAVLAAAGVWLAATWFGTAVGPLVVIAGGLAAAGAEAIAPRATDNLAIPPVVWALLTVVT